jgi:uncharacterized RDD family membrane protein YckC
MKCSKCGYLGFETGDRCKNCGYDFSLMAREEGPGVPEVTIRPDQGEAALPDFALPLFGPYGPDDAPLIALPTSPRPPLAVRRTPESPRLHPGGPPQADRKTSAGRVAVARDRDVKTRIGDPGLRAASTFVRAPELALNFHEDVVAAPEALIAPDEPVTLPRVSARVERIARRRLAAVAIDLALLFAIDLAIVYFTLRIAGLTMSEWAVVPPVPLLMFLMLLKLSYFSAFTAVGGQTIGKMAVGIRVIADGRDSLDGNTAIQRTLAGVLSVVTLGLGFVPALVGSDRRALHDRLTRTRVIEKHS